MLNIIITFLSVAAENRDKLRDSLGFNVLRAGVGLGSNEDYVSKNYKT